MKPAVIRLVLPALLALLADSALAGRWVPIVEGTSRAVYLDTAGAIRDGTVVRTWVREVFTQEQRSEQVGVYYYSANSLVSYDCTTRTFVPLFRVFYGGDGTELRRINLDAVELPALVPPGSVQEGLLERACLPPKAKSEPGKTAPVQVALAETSPKPTAVSASTEAEAAPADKEASKPGPDAAKQQTVESKATAETAAQRDKPRAAEASVTKTRPRSRA